MTPRLFRQMIVASRLLLVLWIAAYWITQPYLPEELRRYLYSIAINEPTTFDWAIVGAGMTLTVVSVVASIGVYLFRRWARWLFLWANLIGIALSPLSGVLIASEWLSPISYFLISDRRNPVHDVPTADHSGF